MILLQLTRTFDKFFQIKLCHTEECVDTLVSDLGADVNKADEGAAVFSISSGGSQVIPITAAARGVEGTPDMPVSAADRLATVKRVILLGATGKSYNTLEGTTDRQVYLRFRSRLRPSPPSLSSYSPHIIKPRPAST